MEDGSKYIGLLDDYNLKQLSKEAKVPYATLIKLAKGEDCKDLYYLDKLNQFLIEQAKEVLALKGIKW